MQDQPVHLAELAERPTVKIHVIPAKVGAHAEDLAQLRWGENFDAGPKASEGEYCLGRSEGAELEVDGHSLPLCLIAASERYGT